MAENTEHVNSEQAPETEAVDWEAKYNEALEKLNETKSHSREWEKRSKENKAALDAQASELEALQKKLTDAASERDTYKVRAETYDIAKEYGIDAGALRGSNADELREHAEYLQGLLSPKNEPVPGAGRSPSKGGGDPELEAVRNLFGSK